LELFHWHFSISQNQFSLTPGFSRVLMIVGTDQPFQRLAAPRETAQTVFILPPDNRRAEARC
jgi:hypothetical protein